MQLMLQQYNTISVAAIDCIVGSQIGVYFYIPWRPMSQRVPSHNVVTMQHSIVATISCLQQQIYCLYSVIEFWRDARAILKLDYKVNIQ